MVESQVLKQHQVEAFQIVSITYREHTPTALLQISTRLNCYGPIGGHIRGD
jgi:hypothetical protein